MRRVRYYEHGGPEVLTVEQAADPVPGQGELTVRPESIGVTLPAVRMVRDPKSPLPGVLGGEVAGEVLAVGEGVTGFSVGDRVVSLPFTGSYAELVVVPAVMTTHLPQGSSASQAVALVRSGHVALAALSVANVKPEESVLVTAAAGGVGHLAVQLAKLQGVPRVVAAVGDLAKGDFLRELGADEVVRYGDDVQVDVVLDGAGGELLGTALKAVRPGGRLVFFNSGGGTIDASDLLGGAKTVTGMAVRHFAAAHRDLYDQHHDLLWKLARDGRLRPAVHAELPLGDAAEAHRIIETRRNLGKVVLKP
ncbi:quinone oxidoreductase family protein [Winogradskya humida]|uniref:Oxidoreductase n=1 Tax=Winogradskya humida TaxID=113566 RepID=A0ABQ3ZLI1_9ACTN|nr:zinc-binding dehydrogenase [Actinoplanes humidus]GIE19441.1 oxidoreductase [Actinoplanes humidus]